MTDEYSQQHTHGMGTPVQSLGAERKGDYMGIVGEKVPSQADGNVFVGPYKQICAERPSSYSYYTKYAIDWNPLDNYQVVQKLGRGKYSEVYQGCNIHNNQ